MRALGELGLGFERFHLCTPLHLWQYLYYDFAHGSKLILAVFFKMQNGFSIVGSLTSQFFFSFLFESIVGIWI